MTPRSHVWIVAWVSPQETAAVFWHARYVDLDVEKDAMGQERLAWRPQALLACNGAAPPPDAPHYRRPAVHEDVCRACNTSVAAAYRERAAEAKPDSVAPFPLLDPPKKPAPPPPARTRTSRSHCTGCSRAASFDLPLTLSPDGRWRCTPCSDKWYRSLGIPVDENARYQSAIEYTLRFGDKPADDHADDDQDEEDLDDQDVDADENLVARVEKPKRAKAKKRDRIATTDGQKTPDAPAKRSRPVGTPMNTLDRPARVGDDVAIVYNGRGVIATGRVESVHERDVTHDLGVTILTDVVRQESAGEYTRVNRAGVKEEHPARSAWVIAPLQRTRKGVPKKALDRAPIVDDHVVVVYGKPINGPGVVVDVHPSPHGAGSWGIDVLHEGGSKAGYLIENVWVVPRASKPATGPSAKAKREEKPKQSVARATRTTRSPGKRALGQDGTRTGSTVRARFPRGNPFATRARRVVHGASSSLVGASRRDSVEAADKRMASHSATGASKLWERGSAWALACAGRAVPPSDALACPKCGGPTSAGARVTFRPPRVPGQRRRKKDKVVNESLNLRYCRDCKESVPEIVVKELLRRHEKERRAIEERYEAKLREAEGRIAVLLQGATPLAASPAVPEPVANAKASVMPACVACGRTNVSIGPCADGAWRDAEHRRAWLKALGLTDRPIDELRRVLARRTKPARGEHVDCPACSKKDVAIVQGEAKRGSVLQMHTKPGDRDTWCELGGANVAHLPDVAAAEPVANTPEPMPAAVATTAPCPDPGCHLMNYELVRRRGVRVFMEHNRANGSRCDMSGKPPSFQWAPVANAEFASNDPGRVWCPEASCRHSVMPVRRLVERGVDDATYLPPHVKPDGSPCPRSGTQWPPPSTAGDVANNDAPSPAPAAASSAPPEKLTRTRGRAVPKTALDRPAREGDVVAVVYAGSVVLRGPALKIYASERQPGRFAIEVGAGGRAHGTYDLENAWVVQGKTAAEAAAQLRAAAPRSPATTRRAST